MKRFMESFEGLCHSDRERMHLLILAYKICDRWGYHGCDMVSAFQYHELDFERFEKAADTYTKTSEQDFQRATEQFWWLMGMGGYGELLHDQVRFDDFRKLMEKEGLSACKQRATKIRERINAVTGQPE